jgi:SAM-dependent methyltransferase
VSRLERLNELYGEEHRRTRDRDFVWGGAERAEPLRRAVGGPGKRILDLGCRSGALTRVYATGNDVVGLDADRTALADAAELGIDTIWADVEEPLPFDDASFDVVVAAELLEHLHDPERLLEEAKRVLRPGGTIAGSVPNSYRLKNRLRSLAGRAAEPNPLHFHRFRPRDVQALLRGFQACRLEYVVGRFVPVHRRLFANVIVFSAQKPA